MNHIVRTKWKEDMTFTSVIDNHQLIIDAQSENGGKDSGPSPKKLLLTALAGCTGMDVISILKKMRVNVKDFNIEIHALMTEEHPKHYSEFHIIYEFSGDLLEEEKLRKAIELSQDRYCGVSHMFRQFAKLTYEIRIF